MKYTLSEPFEFEGKTYDTIDLNIESFNGKAAGEIRRRLEDPSRVIPVAWMDDEYCSLMAAKSAGLPYEFMDAIPASDYFGIIDEIKAFFTKRPSREKRGQNRCSKNRRANNEILPLVSFKRRRWLCARMVRSPHC